MPIPYTPTEAPANRDSVTGPVVQDADPDNAATFNAVFQPLWNLLERVKKKAGFLDLASTWTTLQTFGAGLAGTTAALTGNATVGGTLGVTGAATAASLNTGSGAISGGAVSGTTGTFTGNTTVGGTLGVTGLLSGDSISVSDDITAGGNVTVGATLTAPNVSGNVNIAGTLSATTINGGTWNAVGSAGSTFGTGFANSTTPASPTAFRRTPWDELQFRGVATVTGASSATIFTIPASHRPSVDRWAVIAVAGASQSITRIRIYAATGEVVLEVGAPELNALYLLDNVRVAI